MKQPKRDADTRIVVTHALGPWKRPWARKGNILDGSIDKDGNFVSSGGWLTTYPTHFKILGRFYFRKAR